MKYKKWTIWRANLDPVVGSEQGLTRPVLIFSDDDINELINTINVFPITTRKENRMIYPNEALLEKMVYGLPEESIILCHQIRTLDKRRFAQFYGEINDLKKQNEIIDAVFFQFGMGTSYHQ
jgi:mRNA interferase MazF